MLIYKNCIFIFYYPLCVVLQNLKEIGHSTAELWPKKIIFNIAATIHCVDSGVL